MGKLREARQRKDASLNIRWKYYKDKRKAVKLLRKEKKEMRRKTLEKLGNRGELVVNYSGQTWLKEKEREGV